MYSYYSYFISALDGCVSSASRPNHDLTSGERTRGDHWTEGWVGITAGLDTEVRRKILCL